MDGLSDKLNTKSEGKLNESKLNESKDNYLLYNKLNNITPLPSKYYCNPYNKTRIAKLVVLDDCLASHSEYQLLSVVNRLNMIEIIERACYNYTIDKAHENNIKCAWENENFINIYHSICYKISSNLQKNVFVDNQYLPKLLFKGELDIESMPRLPSHELQPELYKDILIRYHLSKNTQSSVKMSSLYKCRRCHKAQCKYESTQTRSLDESNGFKITCLYCGNEWNT